MKWFKHPTVVNSLVSQIEAEFGLEGYARFYKLMEAIAANASPETDFSVTLSWVEWQSILKGKRNKLETFLTHLENKGELFLKRFGNVLEIKMPNLFKYMDNFSRDFQAKQNR